MGIRTRATVIFINDNNGLKAVSFCVAHLCVALNLPARASSPMTSIFGGGSLTSFVTWEGRGHNLGKLIFRRGGGLGTKLVVKPLPVLPEVKLIETPRFGDSRGFFSETYNLRAFSQAGIETVFV